MKNIVMAPNPYRDRNFKYVHARRIRFCARLRLDTQSICLAFEVDEELRAAQRTLQLCKSEPEELRERRAASVCFGGDGTILHASKAATEAGHPGPGRQHRHHGLYGGAGEQRAARCCASLARRPLYDVEARMMLQVREVHPRRRGRSGRRTGAERCGHRQGGRRPR